MESKKNFDQIVTQPHDTGTSSQDVFDVVERSGRTGKEQPEISEEERIKRLESRHTQGRKGCRMERISLRLSTTNKVFLRIVARSTNQSMSSLINKAMDEYRENHPDLVELCAMGQELAAMTGERVARSKAKDA